MCYPSPGPLCSTTARRRLKEAKALYETTFTEETKQGYLDALQEFMITYDGQDYLESVGETEMLEAVREVAHNRIEALEGNAAPMLLITRGISGSGKSTFAKAWVRDAPKSRVRVNRDEIRVELFGADVDYSTEQEDKVTVVERKMVTDALTSNKDVIVDATHISDYSYRSWGELACRFGAEAIIAPFLIDVDTAKARVAERAAAGGLYVPDEVIERQFRKIEKAEKQRLTLP